MTREQHLEAARWAGWHASQSSWGAELWATVAAHHGLAAQRCDECKPGLVGPAPDSMVLGLPRCRLGADGCGGDERSVAVNWNVINAYCSRCGQPGSCERIDGASVCTHCRRLGERTDP